MKVEEIKKKTFSFSGNVVHCFSYFYVYYLFTFLLFLEHTYVGKEDKIVYFSYPCIIFGMTQAFLITDLNHAAA